MRCFGFSLQNPYVWIFISGIAAGMALRWLTVREGRDGERKRRRSAKWVAACLYLSVAAGLIPVCGYLSGWHHLLLGSLWIFFAGTAVYAFLIARFPRALGILLLFLTGLLVALSIYAFSGWFPVESDVPETTRIAGFRLLRMNDDPSSGKTSMRIETQVTGKDRGFVDLEGRRVAGQVELAFIDPMFFFIKHRVVYRFRGFHSRSPADGNGTSSERGSPDRGDAAFSLKGFLDDPIPTAAGIVPLLRCVSQWSAYVSPALLQTYVITVDRTGLLKIRPESR